MPSGRSTWYRLCTVYAKRVFSVAINSLHLISFENHQSFRKLNSSTGRGKKRLWVMQSNQTPKTMHSIACDFCLAIPIRIFCFLCQHFPSNPFPIWWLFQLFNSSDNFVTVVFSLVLTSTRTQNVSSIFQRATRTISNLLYVSAQYEKETKKLPENLARRNVASEHKFKINNKQFSIASFFLFALDREKNWWIDRKFFANTKISAIWKIRIANASCTTWNTEGEREKIEIECTRWTIFVMRKNRSRVNKLFALQKTFGLWLLYLNVCTDWIGYFRLSDFCLVLPMAW